VRARLEKSAGAEVALQKSRGGVFEITVDGTLVFSKKKLGRFPTEAELDAIARG